MKTKTKKIPGLNNERVVSQSLVHLIKTFTTVVRKTIATQPMLKIQDIRWSEYDKILKYT